MSHETAIDLLQGAFKPEFKQAPRWDPSEHLRQAITKAAEDELRKTYADAEIIETTMDLDKEDPKLLRMIVTYTTGGLSKTAKLKAQI